MVSKSTDFWRRVLSLGTWKPGAPNREYHIDGAGQPDSLVQFRPGAQFALGKSANDYFRTGSFSDPYSNLRGTSGKSNDTPKLSAPPSASPSAPSPAVVPSSATPSAASFDYLNADLAKEYSMDKSVAYQEALSNTAYQRSVADMKAAGLNPAALFGAGAGSQASSSVYVPYQADYASATSQGSYGRSSARSQYNIPNSVYNAVKLVGGLAGAFASKNKVSGYWIGSSASESILRVINGLIQS